MDDLGGFGSHETADRSCLKIYILALKDMLFRMIEDPPPANNLSQIFLAPLDSIGPSPGTGFKEEDSNDFPISSHPGLGKELVFDELCSFQNDYTVPDSQASGKRKRSLSSIHSIADQKNCSEMAVEPEVVEILPPQITLKFDDFSQDSLQDFKLQNVDNEILQLDSKPIQISQEMLAETQPAPYLGMGVSQAIDSQDEDVQKLKAEAAIRISMELSMPLVPESANENLVDDIVEVEGTQSNLNGIVAVEATPIKEDDIEKSREILAVTVERIAPSIQDQSVEKSENIPQKHSAVSLADESADPLVLPESFFSAPGHDEIGLKAQEPTLRDNNNVDKGEMAEKENLKSLTEHLLPKDATILLEGKLNGSNLVLRESDNFNSASAKDSLQNPIQSPNSLQDSLAIGQKLANGGLTNTAEYQEMEIDVVKYPSKATTSDEAVGASRRVYTILQQTTQPILSVDVFLENSSISLTQDDEMQKDDFDEIDTNFIPQDDNMSLDLNANDIVEDSQKNCLSQAASEILPVVQPTLNLDTFSASNFAVPISTPQPSPANACPKDTQPGSSSKLVPKFGQEEESIINGESAVALSKNAEKKITVPQISSLVKSKTRTKLKSARKLDYSLEGISSSPRRTRRKSIPSYADLDTSSAGENNNDEDYEMTQKEAVESPLKVKLENNKSKPKTYSTPRSILKKTENKRGARLTGYSTAQDSSPCMDRTTAVTFKTSRKELMIFSNFKFVVTASNKDGITSLI
jgi:hypothetical protein